MLYMLSCLSLSLSHIDKAGIILILHMKKRGTEILNNLPKVTSGKTGLSLVFLNLIFAINYYAL